MFIYEDGNSLNLTFKGSIPVETPDLVIKGYEDGATLTVNNTTYGTGSKEFEGKAKTLVYQKDNKLVITFRGIAGMNDPEVTIDEIEKDVFAVVASGESVTLSVVNDTIIPITEVTEEEDTETEEPDAEPEVPSEPLVVDETEEEVTEE